MIDSLVAKISGAFDFTFKEFIVVILLCSIFYFSYSTNQTIVQMDNRYQAETYEGAEAVLITLQKLGINTSSGILEFLEPKPAGKTALKRGVTNDEVYLKLLETYGNTAKNAKIAFNY